MSLFHTKHMYQATVWRFLRLLVCVCLPSDGDCDSKHFFMKITKVQKNPSILSLQISLRIFKIDYSKIPKVNTTITSLYALLWPLQMMLYVRIGGMMKVHEDISGVPQKFLSKCNSYSYKYKKMCLHNCTPTSWEWKWLVHGG